MTPERQSESPQSEQAMYETVGQARDCSCAHLSLQIAYFCLAIVLCCGAGNVASFLAVCTTTHSDCYSQGKFFTALVFVNLVSLCCILFAVLCNFYAVVRWFKEYCLCRNRHSIQSMERNLITVTSTNYTDCTSYTE